MNSWTGDVDDEAEDDGDGGEDEQSFEDLLRTEVDGGSPSAIDTVDYDTNLGDIEDEDLLREAWLQLDGAKQTLVEKRIEDLTGETPQEESEDPESDDTDSATNESNSDENEESDDSGWGDSGDDEEDSSEAAEPTVESADEIEGEDEGEEDQTDSEPAESGSGGPPTPDNAMGPGEIAEGEQRWKFLVFGPPKLYKTHFCFTMPEPIAYIDCEGKADDISQKFSDKTIQIWQPKNMTAEPDTKFRRARKALDEAFEWLDWYYENEGVTGTIVVDSMTQMWEWAQTHHKLENYPLKDESEVELSANFKSSAESDWAVVKEYHNGEFRERICDSRYHFCWTAMERQKFDEVLDGDTNATIMEPKGEPDNDYKADTVIHAREDRDRGKVGDLIGCNIIDNKFVGLKKPTFPKTTDAIEQISKQEMSDDGELSRAQLADKIGADAIVTGDPQVYVQQ